MRWRTAGVVAMLLLGAAPAATQVQQPIASRTVLKGAISDRQAADLADLLKARRPIRDVVANPVRNPALADAINQPPVIVTPGGEVTPVSPPVPDSGPEPALPTTAAPSRPTVEIVGTSAAEEATLRGALAGQRGLQQALKVQNSSLITLPGLVRMEGADGAEPLQLKPFILVSAPLRRMANGTYQGQLLVGVSEIVDTAAVRTLPIPLDFQVVGAAQASPSTVRVATTSPPFQEVKVTLRNPGGQTPEVQIFSVIDRGGTRIALPVEGELSVQADSASIEGLGLAKTRLHVSATGLANPAGQLVALQVDPSGFLDANVVKLGADGTGDTELRSDGVGPVRIRASLAGFEPATTSVTFRLPLLTLGAAIGGGFLGAFISFATSDGRRRKRVGLRLVGAALFGVMVFALYVVGINLLPIRPEVTVGAAFVFATAAFAGWLGPSLGDWRRKLPATGVAAPGAAG